MLKTDKSIFGSLQRLLVCPSCHSDLSYTDNQLDCCQCDNQYPVQHNIPLFAQPDKEVLKIHDRADRKRYEWSYQSDTSAKKYEDSFDESSYKKRRTKRELKILRTLLINQPRCDYLLDVPCGGGRLSHPLAQQTGILIEADISPAQVLLAQEKEYQGTALEGLVLSAMELPFADNSVDGIACSRLSHHFPEPSDRQKLLTELLRVAGQFVILSFTDRRSIISLSRRLRGKPVNPCAMSTTEITDIAARNNAIVEQIISVSAFGSRHRYALIVPKS